jgi:hypothetical protein
MRYIRNSKDKLSRLLRYLVPGIETDILHHTICDCGRDAIAVIVPSQFIAVKWIPKWTGVLRLKRHLAFVSQRRSLLAVSIAKNRIQK